MDVLVQLEHIKPGDIYKTERALARALGYPETKDSKTRRRQYEDMRRYVEYELTGRVKRGQVSKEIVITKLIDPPLPEVDHRKNNGNHGKYIDLIKQILLSMRSFKDTYTNLTKRMLGIPSLTEGKNLDDQELFDYCQILYSDMKAKIIKALESIKKEYGANMFNYNNIYLIHRTVQEESEQEESEQEESGYDWVYSNPMETEIINKTIDSVTKKLLMQYNSTKGKSLDKLPRTPEYFRQCREEVCKQLKEKLEIDNYSLAVICINNIDVQFDQHLDEKYVQLRDLYGEHMLHILNQRTTKIDGECVPLFKMSYRVKDLHNRIFPKYPWESVSAEGLRRKHKKRGKQ